MTPESLIQVHEVTRRFGAFVAADRVSFDVPKGQIFGFLGPNGSGKSTTIRILAGLLAASSGRVTGFDGLDVAKDTERWKQQTGYMSQKFSLYLDLTVEENLRFFGMVYGLGKTVLRDRIRDLAARLKFEPLLGSLTRTLSTGQRQRVALAASLLHEPKLLFLDEPTGGVDPRGRRMFWDLIYELAASRGLTVLVTTHYMDEAERCTHVAYVYYGKLLVSGDPNSMKQEEIVATNRRLEIICRPLMPALALLRDAPYVDDVSVFGQALHIRLKDVAPAPPGSDAFAFFSGAARRAEVMEVLRERLAAGGIEVLGLRSVYPSLEDIFVSFTRQMDKKQFL
jgi:ABC-2 type transport system ATP-binding protein